jgi:beta-phosphoglucomutase-like phosphatase (HAD superfamily)
MRMMVTFLKTPFFANGSPSENAFALARLSTLTTKRLTHKPEPAPYRAVLDTLGIAPHEAVAFEDSPNGVTAARAAGIFCVAVPNPVTCRLALDHADYRLASLADEALEQILMRALAKITS